MHRLGVVVGVVSSLVSWHAAVAAPCDCDHVVEPDVGIADGTALGVQPGQSVCVRGGAREYLRLQKFVGAPGQPITIRNCEGVVDISNDDRGYGLTVDESRYVHVTGTGDEAATYGFRARASKDGPDYSAMSVAVGNLSSDIELDHVEAYEAGFAGIMWKTDPRCDLSANLDHFVMYDSRLHHNYVHDTGGEGLYFGSTGYGGREYTCDGQQVILYPHEHHGAQIHDNIFENTGWDGAQIGVTPTDCAFHHNTVRNVGLKGELYQQQGLQIGGASACDVFNNVLMDGPTNGIFVLGADDTFVYNNLIVQFGDSGIYANDQELPLDARFRFAHNTVIVGTGMRGLTVFGPGLGPGYAVNNVIVGPNALGVGGDVPDFTQTANVTAETVDGLGFVDPANRDYHLLPDSPLRDAGVAPPDAVSVDLDEVPRSDGAPDVGAFEYSPEPPPGDDTTGGETGETTDSPTSSADESDSAANTSEAPADTTTTGPGGSADGEASAADPSPTSDGGLTVATADDGTATGSGTDSSGQQDDGGCGCTTTATSPLLAFVLLLAPRRRSPRAS